LNELLRDQLFHQVDHEYQKFHSKLCPNIDHILGVRIPVLRKMAKELAKGDWETYLATAQDTYYEEVLLQGLVIGLIQTDLEDRLHYIQHFVPKIDNWAICDTFCAGLRFTKHHRDRVWDFILPYLETEDEYLNRFSVVMMLDYYIIEDYIDLVLPLLDTIRHPGYYVRMAVAWALSICFIRFPEKTLYTFQQSNQDKFTYNKALQKITESNRVDLQTKAFIRSLKRK